MAPGKTETGGGDETYSGVPHEPILTIPGSQQGQAYVWKSDQVATTNPVSRTETRTEHEHIGYDLKAIMEHFCFSILRSPSTHSGATPRNDSNALSFPEKLFGMIEWCESLEPVAEARNCIGWILNGRAFHIYKPKELTDHVLPRFFKLKKYESFRRKLYRWGFRQLSKDPRHRNTFYSDKFLRDHPERCRNLDIHYSEKERQFRQDKSLRANHRRPAERKEKCDSPMKSSTPDSVEAPPAETARPSSGSKSSPVATSLSSDERKIAPMSPNGNEGNLLQQPRHASAPGYQVQAQFEMQKRNDAITGIQLHHQFLGNFQSQLMGWNRPIVEPASLNGSSPLRRVPNLVHLPIPNLHLAAMGLSRPSALPTQVLGPTASFAAISQPLTNFSKPFSSDVPSILQHRHRQQTQQRRTFEVKGALPFFRL